MRIVIVGAGLTGMRLARYLVQEKHDVSIIESSEERARHASSRVDGLVLHDEGNSLDALEEAGIAKADALICVTGSDEVNMIICGLAASRYRNIVKIARVRNDDYMKLNHSGRQNRKTGRDLSDTENAAAGFREPKILGIDRFIHPDVEAARAVMSALSHGASGNILGFPGTDYELGSINISKGSVLDGLVLKDFRSLVKEDCLITLVERGQESFLPSGSTALERGDRIHILAREENMEQLFGMAGKTETPLRHIGIVGGGRIGSLIAEGLLDRTPEDEVQNNAPREKTLEIGRTISGGLASFFKSFIPRSMRRVVIIEQNYEVCKELAARFPEALILNEDISDESFVNEEKIGSLDLIITATANQELNMIAAIYLKSLGVRRAIALVSGSGYETIARKLGVDVVIPMKSVVVDSILSHLMGGGITGIHSLGGGSVGIMEIEISKDSPAAEKSITEFQLSSGGLVMLVDRGETSFIPRGDYVFTSGDKVIVIAKNGGEGELEKFFETPKQSAPK